MGKGRLIKIECKNGFVDDSETIAYELTYEIKKWYYFEKTKTVKEVMFPHMSEVDRWVMKLNKKLNVWREL